MKAGMEDRREALIDAGLQILREEGLAGFTQPKVAARVGLRQGNLTYYFPTRVDLMAAVARVAVERQLAAAAEMVRSATSADKAVAIIAGVVVRHENTRVLVALNQAADQEPALRELFNELTDGFVAQLELLLTNLGLGPSRDRIDMLHALFVGLSVIDLATSRRNGKARAKAALETAFGLLATDASSRLSGMP
jgi:AcrR family transcriptional regulator